MPKCRICEMIKEEFDFPKNSSYKSGRASLCKECASKKTTQYRREKPLKYKAWKYNVSEAYLEEFLKGRNACEICGSTEKKLVIDHNHQTGRLRGMLCDLCNKGIGALQDDAMILRRAVAYLEDTDGQ